MPFSPPTRMEINRIEDELRNWTGAGTRMDDRYYSYSDKGCPAKTKPIEDAIIYHPPAGQFVKSTGTLCSSNCSNANNHESIRTIKKCTLLQVL